MNRYIFLVALSCALPSLVFAAYPVDAVITQASSLQIQFKAYNRISAEQSVTISSEVSGTVLQKTKRAELGSTVQKGTLLFSLDPIAYQVELASVRSKLAQAELDVRVEQGKQSAAAEQLRFITSTLATQTATVEKDLILRTPYLQVAKARLAEAQKQQQQALEQLNKTQVRAPCSGFVQSTYAQKGEYVNTGSQLAEVVCNNAYQVIATVPMQYYRWLQDEHIPHLQVTLARQFGNITQTLQAHIVRVVPVVAQDTYTAQVYVRIQNPHQESYPVLVGEFVTVRFVFTVPFGVLRLPLAALRGLNTIWIADDENRLTIQTVDVLHQDKTSVYIPFTIKAGTRVVVTPIANPKTGMGLSVNVRK